MILDILPRSTSLQGANVWNGNQLRTLVIGDIHHTELCGVDASNYLCNYGRQGWRWDTLLRWDGGLRAPTQCALETLHRRPSGAAKFRTRMSRLIFSARRAWRSGGKGGRGESPAQEQGAVCADRLAKNRTARTSGVFIGAINPAPITRESPLLPFADWNKPAVGLSRPQILE
jgi:hypothetical protein